MYFYLFNDNLLQEVVKDFERNLQDMVSMFIESIMAFMSTARDLENSHHEKLSEIALPIVDKLAKNEMDDEISEDVRMVMFVLFFIFG